ncbi:UPF0496 protein 4-like [Bidens hawaiensis]|uniref:UPF0496 protein 4-like n=1 Tax=Bidens hawaiensis TaxID=980011 RepID=UPI00404B4913
MFLVDKTHLTSHFKLTRNKNSPVSISSKTYQLAAKAFDEKVNYHLKNLIPSSDAFTSSIFSLSWMTKAVTFISTVHFESESQISQISSLRSGSDYYQDLYMEYSQKVLDLTNLITSAVKQLTERRMLLKLSLRLMDVNSSGEIPAAEKLKKAKDTLMRSVQSVHSTESISPKKAQRAKDLIGELILAVKKFTAGDGGDPVARTLHALGALSVFVTGFLVTVLYGRSGDLDDSDLVNVRVPAEFLFAASVNGVWKVIFDSVNGGQKRRLLEVEDTARRALAVCDVIDDVAADFGEKNRLRLVDGVKELTEAVVRFSGGVDELTNGVNGLFGSVLKTRNGVLDGVRKGDW